MNIRISRYLPIILIILASLINFGLMIPYLGAYLDDWAILIVAQFNGLQGLWEFYKIDGRPLSAWPYLITFPLFGTRLIYWQIFIFVLRILTSLGFYATIKSIWPNNEREVTLSAILFAVYPLFLQQATAVTFQMVWIQYALFFLSLFTMIKAIQKSKWYFPLTGLALLSLVGNLTISEYFIGVELIRPILIWVLLKPLTISNKSRIIRTIKHWLPYFLALCAFLVWRLFLIDPNIEIRDPTILKNWFIHPKYYSILLIQMVLQDMVGLIITTWYNTLKPDIFNLFNSQSNLSWIVAIITSILLALHLRRLARTGEWKNPESVSWSTTAIGIGLLTIFLGLVPAWMIDRQFSSAGLYNDRFGIAAMFGASLLFVGVMELILKQDKAKIYLFCAFFLLSTGSNLRNASQYETSWQMQRNFYWQFAWRIPGLKPGTPLLSNNEFFRFMGHWPTAMAVNLLYPKPEKAPILNLYYFPVASRFGSDPERMNELLNGTVLFGSHSTLTFSGHSKDSIVVHYDQNKEDFCLWILNPTDKDNPYLAPITRQILSLSNMNQIDTNPTASGYPPQTIFGPELPHGWCYYFQKADLARQKKEWGHIQTLWSEASGLNLSPANGLELMPFIEADIIQNNEQNAQKLMILAKKLTPTIQPFLCTNFDRILNDSVSKSSQELLASLKETESCPQ